MTNQRQVDLSKSPVLQRPKIERFVKTPDAAERVKERFEHNATNRMVHAELKRQARCARNRRDRRDYI